MTSDTAPDLIQPVIGFRGWRILDGELYSAYKQHAWNDAVAHAECDVSRLDPRAHQAPWKYCSCGIHAYHSWSVARDELAQPSEVLGVVAMWGRIEVHRNGLRAQHAKIVALGLPPNAPSSDRGVRRIAADLRVEAVPVDQLPAVGMKQGAPVPEQLLAERPERRLLRYLSRCPTCREYRGEIPQARDGEASTIEVLCICQGIPCRYCGKNNVRRPISEYFDEQTGCLWHVPYFAAMRACPTCRARRARGS